MSPPEPGLFSMEFECRKAIVSGIVVLCLGWGQCAGAADAAGSGPVACGNNERCACVLRTIASLLFKIPLKDIDEQNNDLGAAYNYNGYAEPWDTQQYGPIAACAGYDGGHSGVDFQTLDVEYQKTAERSVFSLTSGRVVGVDRATGRVVVKSRQRIHGPTHGVYFGYLHLRSIAVRTGDAIKAGDALGIQGNLGLGFAPSDTNTAEHVHVEVNTSLPPTLARCGAAPAGQVPSVNPEKYFRAIAARARMC